MPMAPDPKSGVSTNFTILASLLSALGIKNYIKQTKNLPVNPQSSGFSLCTTYPRLAQFSLIMHDKSTEVNPLHQGERIKKGVKKG